MFGGSNSYKRYPSFPKNVPKKNPVWGQYCPKSLAFAAGCVAFHETRAFVESHRDIFGHLKLSVGWVWDLYESTIITTTGGEKIPNYKPTNQVFMFHCEQERVRDSEKLTGTQMRCKKNTWLLYTKHPCLLLWEKSMLVIQVSWSLKHDRQNFQKSRLSDCTETMSQVIQQSSEENFVCAYVVYVRGFNCSPAMWGL